MSKGPILCIKKIVSCSLGESAASEFYALTFQNAPSVACEDGTHRGCEMSAHKFQTWGFTQKKEYDENRVTI
jgi:hypothetical protein